MVKGKIGRSTFTITDYSKLVGGNAKVKRLFNKAKEKPIEISEGPVAAVLFYRMKDMDSNVELVERKDPKEEGVVY